MNIQAKSIISVFLLAGLIACAPSDEDVNMVINTGIPVRAKAPINLSDNLMSLMSVTIGQDCYQDQVYIALRDRSTGQFFAPKKVLLRTNLVDVITYGNAAIDVDKVIFHLLNNSALDEPLSILIPKNRSVDVGITGTIYRPADDDGDGICDQDNLAVVNNFWVSEQALTTARYGHTATTLQDGRILITGGTGTSAINLSTAQVFYPASKTWSAQTAFSSGIQRKGHTATLLNDGKVIVIGGNTSGLTATNSVEVYDPNTNTWTVKASLLTARYNHTATLLHGGANEGKVLVAGGRDGTGLISVGVSELYDPASNSWSAGPSGFTPRENHTASFLSNGTVITIGGDDTTNSLTLVDMYNPAAVPMWTPGPPLTTNSRTKHTANLLPNGDLVVVGGFDLFNNVSRSNVDVFSPTTLTWGTWTAKAGLAVARYKHTTTVLPDGRLLVAGGVWNTNPPMNSVVISNPAISTWSSVTVPLGYSKSGHTAHLLPGGGILVVGGEDPSFAPYVFNHAELNLFYSPATYSSSIFGHAVVDSNALNAGTINLRIETLHSTPTFHYGTDISINPSRYRNWVEFKDKSFSTIASANATLDTVSYLNAGDPNGLVKVHIGTIADPSSSYYLPHMFPFTLEFNYVAPVAGGGCSPTFPCSGRYRAVVNQGDPTGLSVSATLIPGTGSTLNTPPPTISPIVTYPFRINTY